MIKKPLPCEPLSTSQYGIGLELEQRACELKGIGSLLIKDLFPRSRKNVLAGQQIQHKIKALTKSSLENVDMSMIKEKDSVNLLASHHSFLLYGGTPYVEMLKTIKEVLKKRTGVKEIRLRVGGGLRFREPEEIIRRFNLAEAFDGKAMGMAPVDRGIPIQTSLGPIYGLKKAYDADWIVHTHNTSMREVHFHRFIDRTYKSFSMSYARLETRSTYHHNFGPRGANFIGRAIVDSQFVKDKLAFSSILKSYPGGISGIDSDNDLKTQSDRLTAECLQEYGQTLHLLSKVDSCIAILDCPGPIPYASTGGVMFANFVGANMDQFDLEQPITPYSYFTEMALDKNYLPLISGFPEINRAIKVVINLYSFKGYPSTFFAQQIPTIVVGSKMADLLRNCPQNSEYMSFALTAENLAGALEFAAKVSRTENILVFDGARGGFNGSYPLLNLLRARARQAQEEVVTRLLPKWLKQRGIGPIVDI